MKDLSKKKLNKKLWGAAYDNDIAALKEAIAVGADVNARDESGWSALMLAALYNYKETAEVLINAGADVNVKSNVSGWTALMWAVQENSKEIVEVLKKAGAKE